MQKQQELHLSESKKYRVVGPCATKFGADNTGSWRLERPSVDYEKCIKCGTCERFCPTNVIEVKNDQMECIVIDFNYCKGCGICVNECPTKCMTLIPERGEI
ncbi:4Fe-4S binding protein [Youngiibacter multivorans]|uniref:4Fe-4S binding protein n=1 Tax=Youngiibacter multivorans TaxID=937251 RepID=UPI001AE29A50|nr:4Fe-4S binding protein [Youngiibacter multivorans]